MASIVAVLSLLSLHASRHGDGNICSITISMISSYGRWHASFRPVSTQEYVSRRCHKQLKWLGMMEWNADRIHLLRTFLGLRLISIKMYVASELNYATPFQYSVNDVHTAQKKRKKESKLDVQPTDSCRSHSPQTPAHSIGRSLRRKTLCERVRRPDRKYDAIR